MSSEEAQLKEENERLREGLKDCMCETCSGTGRHTYSDGSSVSHTCVVCAGLGLFPWKVRRLARQALEGEY